MRSKKKFRIGQRVQLACDPSETFVIRKSRIPERIYFGANRWWTRNELQALGTPENPDTSLRPNGKGKMREDARKCAEGISSEPAAVEWLPKQPCLECGAIFQPKRPWQRFHSENCRRTYWEEQGRRRTKPKRESAADPLAAEESMIDVSMHEGGAKAPQALAATA